MEDKGDAAGEQALRGVALFYLEQVERESGALGAKHEAIGQQLRITEGELCAISDGEECRPIGVIRTRGGVVPVEHAERIGKKEGIHCACVGRSDADGDEALPCAAGGGGMGTEVE